jgi:hypothetical protein
MTEHIQARLAAVTAMLLLLLLLHAMLLNEPAVEQMPRSCHKR